MMPACFKTENRVPAFEIAGPPDAPVVVALGGISAHRHVCATADDPTTGWWDTMVGPARAIDTARWRVLGIDYLDGGSDERGRPARYVSTFDQANALAEVLDQAGIDTVHAVVGASYGGMVALAFAERSPHRLGNLVVIGAAHESHPMTTARREVQRRIVELGLDAGRATQALALARVLAITTYRSAREFAARFPVRPMASARARSAPHDRASVFPVMSYLDRHGERFAADWQTARFIALSLSADLHSVAPARIRTPTMLVAIEDDGVVPPEQMERLAAQLAGPVALYLLPATRGHDAFLTDAASLGPIVARALNAPARKP